ncbi:MAG TPA: hypothetical protein VJK05_04890 [archaeon]|nr:hypothetical protein [archaeon]
MKKENEYYFAGMFLAIAALGRIAMEPLPSVEPIIPIAVYVALKKGSEAGMIVGGFAYIVSNIFMNGGLGFWTWMQALGGAGAALFAASYGKEKISMPALLGLTFIGTIIFETVMNAGYGELLVWPFSYVHIASNLIFAAVIGSSITSKEKKE